jgi:transposase
MAETLLPFTQGEALIADTAYDSDAIVAALRDRGIRPVIHCNPTRKYNRRRLDRKLYKIRYLVEVFFHNLKRFRAIATRYDKTLRNYAALVHVVCAFLWL